MIRRKITGILQYGTRKYPALAQKFQEGGFVAVGKGYDWRDDPYEIMLLKQKAAEENAYIKASRVGSGGSKSPGLGKSGKNIDTLGRVEGGLLVTNNAFNARIQKLEKEYYDKVLADPEWAGNAEGQIAFQRIVNETKRLEGIAKTEEEDFKTALDKIDIEDRQSLAVSADNNVMAWEAATGKGVKLKMSDYLGNLDKFLIMKVDEFATWKKNNDTELQSSLTDEFLKKNAVGYNTLRKTYIDSREDTISNSFTVVKGKIVKKNADESTSESTIIDLDQFKKGLTNLMNNKGFYEGTSVQEASRTNAPLEVANTIFSEIMAGAGLNSRLDASLKAELLADRRQIEYMYKNVAAKDRESYLEEQKKWLLVSKIVDKNSKKDTESSNTDSDVSDYKSKATPLLGDMNSFFDSGSVTRFTFGKGMASPGGGRVVDLNLPMVKDGLTPAEILTVSAEKATEDEKRRANNIYHNPAIQKYTDLTDLYSGGGVNFRSLLPSNEDVKSFFAGDTVIAPDETMPIVLMPMDGDGKIRAKEFMELASVKMYGKKAFLKSVAGVPGMNITTRAEDLLPGNLDPKMNKDSKEYQRWIKKGFDIKMYAKRVRENRTPENIANYKMASDALKVIQYTKAAFDNKFGGSPIKMQPMLGTWIIFDDDNANVKEAMDKNPRTIGNSMIRKLSAREKAFLQDTNGIDNFNWKSDNIYKTMVFSKIKNLGKAAAEEGEKLPGVAQYAEMYDKMLNAVSGNAAASNPELRNIALYLMQ